MNTCRASISFPKHLAGQVLSFPSWLVLPEAMPQCSAANGLQRRIKSLVRVNEHNQLQEFLDYRSKQRQTSNITQQKTHAIKKRLSPKICGKSACFNLSAFLHTGAPSGHIKKTSPSHISIDLHKSRYSHSPVLEMLEAVVC